MHVSMASKLKLNNLGILLPVVFFVVVGIVFLVLLPMNNYPPHIALTGVLALITAYGLFTKRYWGPWMVLASFFAATGISVITLYYTLTSDALVSIGIFAYLVPTWIITLYVMNNRTRWES